MRTGRPALPISGDESLSATEVAPSTPIQRKVLAVFALAGFAGLALEVVWFRILVLFIPATTYAFTTMLAIVLLGIALGSAIASAGVRQSVDLARALAHLQIATGVLVVLSMAALAYTYQLGWRTSAMIQASVLAILPAAMLMGAAFPLGLAIWLRDAEGAVGKRVGALYATNVCGAVIGALAGGFLLLPLAGSRVSLLLIAAIYGFAGWLLMAAHGWRTGLRYGAGVAILLTAVSLTLPDLHDAVLARRHGKYDRQVFRAEGVQTTATVHFQPPGPARAVSGRASSGE